MGNYNSICEVEGCRTKVRKVQTDIYHCKYHRCATTFCNLPRTDAYRCEYHTNNVKN